MIPRTFLSGSSTAQIDGPDGMNGAEKDTLGCQNQEFLPHKCG